MRWRVSQCTFEIAWVSSCLTDVYVYGHIDPHCIGHVYDPLSHRGSTVYPFMAMVMSIIHVYYTWIFSLLYVGYALFPLSSMGIPSLGIIMHGSYLVVCMFSLPGSLALPFAPPLLYIVKFFGHHLLF